MVNRIKECREESGLTQDELAKKAGVSRPFLSNVENGVAIPTVTKAADIAEALGRSIDQLFSMKDTN